MITMTKRSALCKPTPFKAHSRAKEAVNNLRAVLQPYLFYWQEWITDENCSLTVAEKQFINTCIETDFMFAFRDYFMPTKKIVFIEQLSAKLELGSQVFREFVVLHFLYKVIWLGHQYNQTFQLSRLREVKGAYVFYDTPLSLLHICQPLKDCFKAFGVFCIRLIFFRFNQPQLCRGWVYERIVQFHIVWKAEQNNLISKSHLPMEKPK